MDCMVADFLVHEPAQADCRELRGRFLLPRHYFNVQTGPKFFELEKCKSSAIFALDTSLKSAFLYVCLMSSHFVFYPYDEIGILNGYLNIKFLTFAPDSLHIVQGSL